MMYNGMGYASLWGFFINIILILFVVAVAVALLNKSWVRSSENASFNNERLAKIESEIRETRKMVEEIKDKLDEI